MNRLAFPVATLPVPLQQFASEVENVFDQLFTRGEEQQGGDSREIFYNPRMNVVEYEDHYAITLDLPGVRPADVSVELKEHRLMISGERHRGELPEGARAWRAEAAWGKFRKSVQLPETIDADGVDATYDYGVLMIRVPKQPKAAPRQINIRIQESNGQSESQQAIESNG